MLVGTKTLGAIGLTLALAAAAFAQTATYDEPCRPQFHFSVPVNWPSDPTGLVSHKGEWHVFYQHNPFGEGVGQIHAYMDRCGAESGHSAVFDRRENRSWDDRVFRREEMTGNRAVTVWDM